MADKLDVPSPSDQRDSMLRVIRSGLIRRGVAEPNVTKESDHYVACDAFSQHLSPISANQQDRADQMMPDTAEGDDMIRWLDIFELTARPAQGSYGNIVLPTSAASFVETRKQLVDGQGQVFEVTVGGTYVNEAEIPIQAMAGGAATNHPQGYPLQWVSSPPPFADPVALVAVGGLIGGAEADDTEAGRNRLFSFFRNPPQGGNWTQVTKWATDASASVAAAYAYPALNGPATYAVCVVGPLTWDSTNGWSRGVSDAVLASVQAYIIARLPESTRAGFVCKTPKDTGGATPNVDADVAIGLALPLAVTGGGPGGGWTDATPWPELLGTATRCYVSGVTSSTEFTLTSDDPGTSPSLAGVFVAETKVAWFSSSQFADDQDPIIVATVIAASGTTGSITVTLSAPFTGIAVGDFVFPDAENVQAYARAYLAAMNGLGPGQWTSHPAILVHAKRQPLVTAASPSDLTATITRALTDSGDEVGDVAFLYRSVSSPGVPASTTTTSPNILVPQRVAFYNRID